MKTMPPKLEKALKHERLITRLELKIEALKRKATLLEKREKEEWAKKESLDFMGDNMRWASALQAYFIYKHHREELESFIQDMERLINEYR